MTAAAPPLSTTQRRIVEQAATREKKLAALEARQRELEAELQRPSDAAAELIRLEESIRAASYSAENARQTAIAEYRDAKAEYDEARAGLLTMLAPFIEAHERAHAARGRLNAAQRAVSSEGFMPVPRLGLGERKELLPRWRRATRRGFDL